MTSATRPLPADAHVATTRPPRTGHASPLRRAGTFAAALLGSLAIATAAAPAALAHDTLISSTPEDGAELDSAPEEIVLTFSSDIGEGGNAIVVTGPEGENHEDGDTSIDGPEATVALAELPAAGEYTVAYRMVSSDGHTLEDEVTFSITEEAVPEPSASPSAEQSSPAGGDEGANAEQSPAAATDPAGPMSSMGPIAGVIGAIAVIAIIAILIIRLRTRPRPDGQNSDDG